MRGWQEPCRSCGVSGAWMGSQLSLDALGRYGTFDHGSLRFYLGAAAGRSRGRLDRRYIDRSGGLCFDRWELPGAGPQPFAGALFEYRLIYSEPGEGRIKAELDGAVLYLDPNPVITEADLTEVRPNITREGLILSVDMTPTAAARLRQVTGKNIGRRMALVFDSQVVSAPTIQSAVGGFAFVKVPVADPDAAATLVRKRWPPSQRE